MGAALGVRDLQIAFPGPDGALPVLSVAALALGPGESLGVAGPSGAGKSSLLHALAGIERPHGGEVRWDGVSLWALPGGARDRWRRESLGLVFQEMHLVEGLSALENVLLPVRFDHARVPSALRERGAALLGRLGVAGGRRAAVMSRGERQRVALARALLRRPRVLIADEPTASLDAAAAGAVGALLVEAAVEGGATLVVATHDPALLARMGRAVRLVDGALAEGVTA